MIDEFRPFLSLPERAMLEILSAFPCNPEDIGKGQNS
jgi:hypothetical protein